MLAGSRSTHEHRRFIFRGIVFGCILACGVSKVSTLHAQDKFFESTGYYAPGVGVKEIPTGLGYNPMPHLTSLYHGGEAFNYTSTPPSPSTYSQTTYAWQQANSYVGFFPLAGPVSSTDEEANHLQYTVDWLHYMNYRLDYALADFENTQEQDDMTEMVNIIRNDTYSQINQARIGNYAYRAGSYDMSSWYPANTANQTSRDSYYRTSGLDVSMPVAYPYAYAKVHGSSYIWSSTTTNTKWWTYYTSFASELTPNHYAAYAAQVSYMSPNQRSSLFYSPLESVSQALRHLPVGHEVIPWVTDFVYSSNTSYKISAGELPTEADIKASIQHYRLRGVSGFFAWTNPLAYTGLTYDDGTALTRIDWSTYLSDISNAWHELDPIFTHSGAQRTLNLDTSKTTGLEWSAVAKGNRVQALVTNLNHSTAQSQNWSAYLQLPAQSPIIPTDTHIQLQYRSSYLDNNDTEQYALGYTMAQQASGSYWNGPDSALFLSATPLGTGNMSAQTVNSTGTYAIKRAWYAADNPGYTASDKVVYSAWLYNGNSVACFAPSNTTGANTATMPDSDHQGPAIWINWGKLTLRTLFDGGTRYDAVNLNVNDVKSNWYEIKMVVDPTIGNGLASVWARNVTDGQMDFTRVVFDDSTTASTTEHMLYLPLSLSTNRNTTNFNGWSIEAYGANNGFDNINTGYEVPSMDDNFEHYDSSMTNDNQFADDANANSWHGAVAYHNGVVSSGPSVWTTATPSSTGNTSSLAATPTSDAYAARSWWKTKCPDFESAEPVVYSAQLYGTSGVGFEAVNTNGSGDTSLIPSNQVGFYTYIYWNTFRFRGSRDGGDNYQATNFTPQSGKWYNVQVQIDPTRDIDGNTGGYFGVARVWIKNLTDNTDPVLVTFDNLATTGSTESITEIPMMLSTTVNNPTLWDGWEVYGYNQYVQVDGFRSFLYPFNDYQAHNQYIDDASLNVQP